MVEQNYGTWARNSMAAAIIILVCCVKLAFAENATDDFSRYQISPSEQSSFGGDKCPIHCRNGGRCVRGDTNFEMFNNLRADGKPFTFLQENSRDGFHCGCPFDESNGQGFTGVLCNRPYEFRASNDTTKTGHVCFHGGRIIEGLEAVHSSDQQFCDCSQAFFEGKQFEGKFCEEKVEDNMQVCDSTGAEFCIHGICRNSNATADSKTGKDDEDSPCICAVGFTGTHCEFLDSQEPPCDLDCGPGQCRVTYGHYDDLKDYGEYWRHNVNQTYCSCPPGFTGTTCEIKPSSSLQGNTIDVCDNSMKYFCVNGLCKSNFREIPERPCSCSPGFDGPHCEFLVGEVPKCELDCGAGHCQIGIQKLPDATTNYTRIWQNSVNPLYCSCPQGHHGLNCELNVSDMSLGTCGNAPNDISCIHGLCSVDPSTQKAFCRCKKGYEGARCQYKHGEVPDCNLPCQNGHCVLGNKYIQNITQKSELDLLSAFSGENFMHCVCDDGYTGNYCETKVEVCGNDNHICLMGSKCLQQDDGSYRCDCTEAFTREKRYAGKYCQHHHTDVCTPTRQLPFTGGLEDNLFCVNDGRCTRYVDPNDPHEDREHPGCDCGPMFYGTHCEFSRLYTEDTIEEQTEADNSNCKRSSAVYLFFLVFVFVAFGVIAWRMWGKHKEVVRSAQSNELPGQREGENNQVGSSLEDVEIL